jgi:hypothetical protein
VGIRDVPINMQKGGPGTSPGRYVLPGTKLLRRIGDRDMVVVNDDLAKDSVIHYTRGKVACKRCGEPRRADALDEEGVCRSINVCLRYQHQEVEIMTSTLTVDWKKDNTIPPSQQRRGGEDHAGRRCHPQARLLDPAKAQRGVGRSLRSLMAAQEAEASVALDESPEGAHTAKGDNHALFVTQSGEVFDPVTNVGPDQQGQAHDIAHEHAANVARAIENARKLQQEAIALGAGTSNSGEPVDPSDHRPWPQGDLSSWPRFSEIRTRAIRAKKLNQAADLLQEVGGHDDAVLTIMSETEFSDLESEVLDLLTMYGEIE